MKHLNIRSLPGLLSWYKPVCLEVRSKGGENRPWAARLQGTWQGPHTWHQLTCSPPVGWTQVAEVSAGCHPEDAETARACRVGRQWGQRAAWWSLGAPPGGALPCQEDDAAPARCAVLSVSVSLSRQCLAPKRLVETPEAKEGPVRLGGVVEQWSSRARLPGFQSFICQCVLGKCLHFSVPSLFMGRVNSMHV